MSKDPVLRSEDILHVGNAHSPSLVFYKVSSKYNTPCGVPKPPISSSTTKSPTVSKKQPVLRKQHQIENRRLVWTPNTPNIVIQCPASSVFCMFPDPISSAARVVYFGDINLATDVSMLKSIPRTGNSIGLYHIWTGFTRACNRVAHRRAKIRTPANCREAIHASWRLDRVQHTYEESLRSIPYALRLSTCSFHLSRNYNPLAGNSGWIGQGAYGVQHSGPSNRSLHQDRQAQPPTEVPRPDQFGSNGSPICVGLPAYRGIVRSSLTASSRPTVGMVFVFISILHTEYGGHGVITLVHLRCMHIIAVPINYPSTPSQDGAFGSSSIAPYYPCRFIRWLKYSNTLRAPYILCSSDNASWKTLQKRYDLGHLYFAIRGCTGTNVLFHDQQVHSSGTIPRRVIGRLLPCLVQRPN